MKTNLDLIIYDIFSGFKDLIHISNISTSLRYARFKITIIVLTFSICTIVVIVDYSLKLSIFSTS